MEPHERVPQRRPREHREGRRRLAEHDRVVQREGKRQRAARAPRLRHLVPQARRRLVREPRLVVLRVRLHPVDTRRERLDLRSGRVVRVAPAPPFRAERHVHARVRPRGSPRRLSRPQPASERDRALARVLLLLLLLLLLRLLVVVEPREPCPYRAPSYDGRDGGGDAHALELGGAARRDVGEQRRSVVRGVRVGAISADVPPQAVEVSLRNARCRADLALAAHRRRQGGPACRRREQVLQERLGRVLAVFAKDELGDGDNLERRRGEVLEYPRPAPQARPGRARREQQ